MSRPAGVTASAIVALLGSILALVFAALAIASLFIELPQSQPRSTGQIIVADAALSVAIAGIGIWTSIGLFRLRPWARTAILIFAGFLAAGSVFSLMLILTVPIPDEFSAATGQTFRRTMTVVFGIPLAIAIWWLIQFNTRSTKAAFASPTANVESPRPLSITVIAVASILGGVSCLFGILTRAPLFLFGAMLNGWIGGVIYAVFGALTLYIGKGLLELREEARILAIGWFGFSLVHSSFVALVPGLRKALLELQQGLDKDQPPIPFDIGMLMNVAFVLGAIVSASAIFFLIRNRAAFGRTENF